MFGIFWSSLKLHRAATSFDANFHDKIDEGISKFTTQSESMITDLKSTMADKIDDGISRVNTRSESMITELKFTMANRIDSSGKQMEESFSATKDCLVGVSKNMVTELSQLFSSVVTTDLVSVISEAIDKDIEKQQHLYDVQVKGFSVEIAKLFKEFQSEVQATTIRTVYVSYLSTIQVLTIIT